MRVFGKKLSNWWLLAIIPIALVMLPVLLMGFFMANNFAGAMFGPPAIWNRPWHTPSRPDLVGNYVEYKRHLDGKRASATARLTLNADGTMSVSDLPSDFETAACSLSGVGSWKGPDDDGIGITITSDLKPGLCQSGFYGGLQLAGHSNPYRLYWTVGDPDSGTGVWLRKQ